MHLLRPFISSLGDAGGAFRSAVSQTEGILFDELREWQHTAAMTGH